MSKKTSILTLIIISFCFGLTACGIKPDHVDPPAQTKEEISQPQQQQKTYSKPAATTAYPRTYPDKSTDPAPNQPPPF